MERVKCPGCQIPFEVRVNLPKNWTEGFPIPAGTTIHHAGDDPAKPFVLDHYEVRRLFLNQEIAR